MLKLEIRREKTKLLDNIKNLKDKVGKVGWFENSKYSTGEQLPVAYVAAVHEYGNPAKHIPARPFMRPTIDEKQNEWKGIIEKGAKQVVAGKSTLDAVLEAVGSRAAGEIRKKIASIQSPALSPKTIANRLKKKANKKVIGKLTKPLIETGVLYGTLTNTVEDI